MNDDLQNLYKMFNAKLFRIPDYQRGYAWTEDQLSDYWSDLTQIPDDGNHYTGVLTLETVPEETFRNWHDDQWIMASKGFDPFYVVDGQQRLTTSIILIQCIAETLTDDDDELNYTTKKEIQKKYLFDKKSKGVSRSYIFGYEKDNPSYEYLKTEIFNESSPSDRKEETVYTNNLLFAKAFFSEQLSKLKKEEVEKIYARVTQKLLFNIFTISEEVDVCVAFETMNNRGKPLSYLELLKNRLIYLSTKLDVSSFQAQDLRRTVNECWKTVYHNLGRNKHAQLDDDFFLRAHHFLNFIEPAPEKVENQEDGRKHHRVTSAINEPHYRSLLNDIFTFGSIADQRQDDSEADSRVMDQIHSYSISLQDAVKVWHNIFNPEPTNDKSDHNFWLSRINRISAPSIYPVLLAIMLSTKKNEDRATAFQAIERSLFVSRLSTGYWRYEPIGASILSAAIRLHKKQISLDDLIKAIESDTERTTKSDWGKKQIKEAMRNKNYYTWRAIHYLLYEYNFELQLRSKTSREKIDWEKFVEQEQDYQSVEHIYPQRARGVYWRDRFSGLTAGKRDALRNVVGNLLPLSKPKNASLSNVAFPDKISGRTPGVGYANGSYAEIEVSQKYAEWNPEAILDRSLNILDFIESRWRLSLGTDTEKTEMLGLGFIKPFQRKTPRVFHHPESAAVKSGSKKVKSA